MDTDTEETDAGNPWGRLEAVGLTGGVSLALTLGLTGADIRQACAYLTLWVGSFACIFAFLALWSTRDEGRAAVARAAARLGILTATFAGRAMLPDPVGIDVALFGGLCLILFQAAPGVRAALRHTRENPMPRLRP